jgi:putative transposase
VAILCAMRGLRAASAASGADQETRRDLLLEILALRHQLSVLARSNRRFRTSDCLLWLILRRVWPHWRDALLLVQPATVDRWHRRGCHRWWRRRPRRPGRPRIDQHVEV